MGVNVSNDFMRLASTFLNCTVGVLPFKYLGLLVGANSGCDATWEPLLVFLRKRLGLWGNKYVRRIQREFLWGGRSGRKKISWIKWDIVCLPKKKGGLGVRDIRMVNISLLAKWRLRLLHDEQAVWKEVLKSKYVVGVVGKTELGEEYKPWFASLWWRDICSIGSNLNHNWFDQSVVKKLGNGMCTSFWKDTWVGDRPLCDRFPRLFSISTQKDALVADVRNPNSSIERWRMLWRQRFFEWETCLFNELMKLINTAKLLDEEDRWGWVPEGGQVFTKGVDYDWERGGLEPLEMPKLCPVRRWEGDYRGTGGKNQGFVLEVVVESIKGCSLSAIRMACGT
ncbi:uncharacterized protein LOC123896664 [Trifolium pratense]|uniref:uncharacterized protein LOC123896664 n=1 Tax=Trifolium pratense TaxID=57577 RepID=UPI001E69435E|nr:uncharacterized protein LOC123896664 [Trifolium pratense]